jgi:hypothetical protein
MRSLPVMTGLALQLRAQLGLGEDAVGRVVLDVEMHAQAIDDVGEDGSGHQHGRSGHVETFYERNVQRNQMKVITTNSGSRIAQDQAM